jgi:hypothetical protein
MRLMDYLHGRWSSLKRRRLRVVAALVLVIGVAGACLFYWIQTRAAGPTMDDLMPGCMRWRERQMGIVMGSLGKRMMEWRDALKEPRTQAIIIAALSALVAVALFRVARLPRRARAARCSTEDFGRRSAGARS